MEMLKVRDPNVLTIFLFHAPLTGIVGRFGNVTPRNRELPTIQRDDFEISCISRNASKSVLLVGRAGQLPPIAVRGF
jgi:hypothetical protein